MNAITGQLRQAHKDRLEAANDKDRIAAEVTISQLEARQAVLVAEQGNWATRWVRPALAFPVVVFWWKVIIWDTVLGLGVTPNPGEYVMAFVVSVPNVYFLVRGFEKWRSR